VHRFRPGRLLLLLLLVAVLALASGCGGSSSDDEASSGEELYRSNCATCHGTDGSGGLGKNLHGVADRLTVEEHIEIVTNGKPPMPKFGGQLSADEIEAVVEYERTELGP
jgi:mono/diheme cytochrome c family protein